MLAQAVRNKLPDTGEPCVSGEIMAQAERVRDKTHRLSTNIATKVTFSLFFLSFFFRFFFFFNKSSPTCHTKDDSFIHKRERERVATLYGLSAVSMQSCCF